MQTVGGNTYKHLTMNRNYSFKHWLTTLFFAPFLLTLYELLFNPIKGQMVGLLEVYPVTLVFSLFFSLPTFIIYYFVFLHLIKKHTNPALTKLILISFTVFGIVTTETLIGGSSSMTFIFSYSLSAIITGILLKIKIKADSTERLNTIA